MKHGNSPRAINHKRNARARASMEFDTATITGIVILGVFFVLVMFWIFSRKDEGEFPKQKRWKRK